LSIAAAGYNKRILSGLRAEADGDVGPLTIELTPVPPGEKPKTEMTGIGAALGPTKNGFEVTNVMDGGGAERVGIVRGDIIVAIDGTAASSLDLGAAVERIRGEEGSVVRLTVKRADGSQTELTVVRRRVSF
jgi:carboxyl-terminal processing protease